MSLQQHPPIVRPIIRYHGAKWRIAPWVLEHFPAHRVYVEPFGGGASLLLQKERAITEIYNDMDNELVNLFRVLRDPEQAARLRQALTFTLYARDEYDAAYAPSPCPVEQARRTLIKTWLGAHSKGLMNKSGFDTRTNKDGYCSRVNTFVKLPELIEDFQKRLKGVVIENTDALRLIPRMDAAHTLFYVDPPYVPEGRSGKYYQHEMTEAGHRELAALLCAAKGMVVISGYPGSLYDKELYADWHREECEALTDGAHARTEVLWLNEAAARGLRIAKQLLLFPAISQASSPEIVAAV